jgi:hypothetical protein
LGESCQGSYLEETGTEEEESQDLPGVFDEPGGDPGGMVERLGAKGGKGVILTIRKEGTSEQNGGKP